MLALPCSMVCWLLSGVCCHLFSDIHSHKVTTEGFTSTRPSARSALSHQADAGSARLLSHSPVPSEGEAESTLHVVVWSCVAAVTMMLLSVVGVCVLVGVLVLRQRFSQTQFELPLTVEKRQVDVMKEIGYVNPTYRFHELQESKDKTCH